MKMMSYLEGDSLLKDIQKSLAIEDEDEEDESDGRDDDDENEEEEEDQEDANDGGVTDTDFEMAIVRDNSNKKDSNKAVNKSLKSGSFTRPSSSMTYHTQSSQLRKRKAQKTQKQSLAQAASTQGQGSNLPQRPSNLSNLSQARQRKSGSSSSFSRSSQKNKKKLGEKTGEKTKIGKKGSENGGGKKKTCSKTRHNLSVQQYSQNGGNKNVKIPLEKQLSLKESS